ncbi:hypothetical protein MmiHf6_13180 [Methanimicrococcus hongohii]|uniref:Uncharacterized protein n=1 Tax=Methanimicrococcus hongohii TaxID=3028295 RepID=A0AA97A2D9_9EURY|nr:hypothetical protein [Methanimicrococcus sp. Hf6]WNY23993.1 hypothetical protein MmiHf6_13180 [Methanimicrococcus sp. Hf6]
MEYLNNKFENKYKLFKIPEEKIPANIPKRFEIFTLMKKIDVKYATKTDSQKKES